MRLLITIFLFACLIFSAKGQIKSGSFQIDGDLNHINASASADFGQFKANMSAGYNISENKIDYYHAELNMAPSDIYFALEMSKVSRRPVEDVVEVYKVKKTRGWGEIAKELGIKPGSDEFHALKNKAVKKSAKYKGSKSGKGNQDKSKGNKSKNKK